MFVPAREANSLKGSCRRLDRRTILTAEGLLRVKDAEEGG
jgi:hypothetical protein